MNPPIIFPDQQHSKANSNVFVPSKSVFIGDLSYFCTEDHLFLLFAPYGPVLQVYIRRGVRRNSLMHGFIVLENKEKAISAKRDVDRKEFMGRNIM
jgi:RNA recognition motif-containing protein